MSMVNEYGHLDMEQMGTKQKIKQNIKSNDKTKTEKN